jgi:hypothetical protein
MMTFAATGRLGATLALALLAALPAAARAGEPVPTDPAAFTDFVAARVREQPLSGLAVAVKGPLTLSIGELQGNLDRIFAVCRKTPDACQAEVDRYALAVAQVARDLNAPPAKDAVRLVVRPAAYVRQLESAGGKAPHAWPLAADLFVLPMLDMPRTTRSLSEGDYKKLELSADQVYQLGQANLEATLKPLMSQARVAKGGQIGHLAGDPYESSRLALHDSWAPLVQAQGGVLIVAAPARDALFYVGEDTPQAIDVLRVLAAKVAAQAPNPLSKTLLRWTQAGWEAVP